MADDLNLAGIFLFVEKSVFAQIFMTVILQN